MKEEELRRLDKEGKLQETLMELKKLSETWEKMANKHKSILADYASTRPESTDFAENAIAKEKELTEAIHRDLEQIEGYLARKRTQA